MESMTKEVYGLKLWIWIAIGASSVVLIGLIIVIGVVLRRNKQKKVRERKQASKQGSGSFNVVFCFFHVEEGEEVEIHAAASYSQRLLPVQQVLPPRPFLGVIQ